MEKQGVKTRDLVEMALFAAIIVILAFTPLGYIPLGVITPTTVHIPVIIAGIILGWKKGAFAGFVFGLTSFLKASFIAPNITSFLFSPLYPGGNFWSLVICFIPRILVGVIAYFVFTGLMKAIKNRSISIAISAFLTTIIHTILVMGMAYIFFAQEYAEAVKISIKAVKGAILAIVVGNGIPEAIVAAVISTAVCTALFAALRNRR